MALKTINAGELHWIWC